MLLAEAAETPGNVHIFTEQILPKYGANGIVKIRTLREADFVLYYMSGLSKLFRVQKRGTLLASCSLGHQLSCQLLDMF